MDTLMTLSKGGLVGNQTPPPVDAAVRNGVDREAAAEAAREFEAVFLSHMLAHLWEGVETDGLFGGGHAEEMTRSLLVDEYANAMAQNGGIGIADLVKAEIIRLQEGTTA